MADVWIRPYSAGPYGSNNGTSYDDAYYRARDVVLAAGDTLYVSGTLDDGGSDGYAFTQIFRGSNVEGTETSRIVIDGAPDGRPAGKIIAGGANKIEVADWTNEGSGVWSIAGIGGSASWLYNEVEAWPNSDRFLFDHGSVPTSGDAPAFHKDGSNKLWYAPLTGTPTQPVWTSGGAFLDFWSTDNADTDKFNPDYVTVKNLTIRNCSNTIRLMHNKHWIIDNCDFGWTAGVGIDPRDGTDDLTIQNTEIHHCISGIYSSVGGESNGVEESTNRCLVKSNHIHDIKAFGGAEGDCHGIGWQNGSDNRWTENILEDIQGTGITVYIASAADHPSRVSNNNEIDNNIVRRVKDVGQATSVPNSIAHGIEWTGGNNNRTSAVESGNSIHHNTISDITKLTSDSNDDGWALRVKTHKHNGVSVYENTISNSTYGLYLYSQNVNGGDGGGEAGGHIYDNTITGCDVGIGYSGIVDVSGYTLTNNTFSNNSKYEVLQASGSEETCELHGGTWGQPNGKQCTLYTVGQYFLYTNDHHANEYREYRGAVEPSEDGSEGNIYQSYRGAVAPIHAELGNDFVSSAGRSASSVSSARRFEEINGQFFQVFSDEHAQALRDRHFIPPDPEPEPPSTTLRMTPEAQKILSKFKKKKQTVPDGGLIGQRKGIL